ncbi:transcription factor RFX3-like isoform X3 [Ptychodera flava]|uniref:transcription factor RFX3-like isoform X3 n=1 Tax=Ptychodera flava TaxID=63121 RepID=UPI00396AA14A
MATQNAYVTEMQAPPIQSQEQQPSIAQQTIIQSQGQPTQQFVQVTVSAAGGNDNLNKDNSSEGAVNLQTNQNQQQQQQTVYPSHVQFVEGSTADQTIYANGTIDSTTGMYTQAAPQTANFFNAQGTATTTGVVTTHTVQNVGTMGTVGALNLGQTIMTNTGGTYLVQGHTMDGEGHPITHTTRASPATDYHPQVQWLVDNYETAEGVSLPRSTLYNHYLRHCQEQKLDPVNAASFGKLIRSVFLGLRTRRLGTRGNSKYHYYGIRIKATSPLNQLQDDVNTTAMRQQPINSGKRFKATTATGKDGNDVGDMTSNPQNAVVTEAQQQQHSHQQYLGDATQALPQFSDIDFGERPLPDGLTKDDIKAFQSLYREHCEAILDVVVNLQFALIEALWQTFWRNPPSESQTNTNENELEKRLPKAKLYSLCKSEPVLKYLQHYDHMLYQGLVEVLIPDVLRPIPSALTQAIRNFAKSLEGWLKNSMQGVPQEMISAKLGAVSAFAQTLRRYTSLNHLAQAARAVLQNSSQINQMLSDLNRVDFANVQEQASWVCQCEDQVVQRLEQDFKMTLQNQNTLEQWAIWLESVVNQVLTPHEGKADFAKAARQFLLKWSFYSSMVIRDLTLRSAASFGSFHLIRLLYDEYMFYLIEHKVAAATGETPIAVMGELYFQLERHLDYNPASLFNIGMTDLDEDNSQKKLKDKAESETRDWKLLGGKLATNSADNLPNKKMKPNDTSSA